MVSPPLLDYLCSHAVTMVTDKATSVTVSDILGSACGDLRPAMAAVAQLANQELVPGGREGQVSLVQNLQESWGTFPSLAPPAAPPPNLALCCSCTWPSTRPGTWF